MKHILQPFNRATLLCAMCVSFLFFCNTSLSGQTAITYTYDNAGNRISRQQVSMHTLNNAQENSEVTISEQLTANLQLTEKDELAKENPLSNLSEGTINNWLALLDPIYCLSNFTSVVAIKEKETTKL
ncbi:MAG: hypothetical protein LBM62_05035 [Mediterranea sp.]|jgi:hypothetical protein|nr:hypothetical protein [Mediterranea sp.]